MINTKESSERSTDAFTQDYNWWQGRSRGESIRCDELDLQSGIGCAPLLFVTNWPCRTLGISLTINTWWQKRCWGRLHFIITGSRRTGTQTQVTESFFTKYMQTRAADGDFKSINAWKKKFNTQIQNYYPRLQFLSALQSFIFFKHLSAHDLGSDRTALTAVFTATSAMCCHFPAPSNRR